MDYCGYKVKLDLRFDCGDEASEIVLAHLAKEACVPFTQCGMVAGKSNVDVELPYATRVCDT